MNEKKKRKKEAMDDQQTKFFRTYFAIFFFISIWQNDFVEKPETSNAISRLSDE